MRPVTITSCPFVKRGEDGDYAWMVKQRKYASALFIIMENFIDSLSDESDKGGGTAVLRPLTWPHTSGRPRATGIPTGWSSLSGGFPDFDRTYTKRAIDLAMERVVVLLDQYPVIDTIVFSCDPVNPMRIGTGIFASTVGDGIIKYISACLQSLPNAVKSKFSLEGIREKELELLPFALNVHERARQAQEIYQLRIEKQKLIDEIIKLRVPRGGRAEKLKIVGAVQPLITKRHNDKQGKSLMFPATIRATPTI